MRSSIIGDHCLFSRVQSVCLRSTSCLLIRITRKGARDSEKLGESYYRENRNPSLYRERERERERKRERERERERRLYDVFREWIEADIAE